MICLTALNRFWDQLATMIATLRRIPQFPATAIAMASAAHAEELTPDPAKDKAAFDKATAVRWTSAT